MMRGFMQWILSRLHLTPESVAESTAAAWLDREEQRKLEQVRARLERVSETLMSIDRRKEPRGKHP